MNTVLEAILGGSTVTMVMLYIQAYGEGYAKGIADTFDIGLSMTQRQLQRLEANGVLVSRSVGSSRMFTFNDRNPTVRNLKIFLEAELENLPTEINMAYFRQRRRPRRSGKRI